MSTRPPQTGRAGTCMPRGRITWRITDLARKTLRRLRRELLDTEPATVIQLRNLGMINDGVLR